MKKAIYHLWFLSLFTFITNITIDSYYTPQNLSTYVRQYVATSNKTLIVDPDHYLTEDQRKSSALYESFKKLWDEDVYTFIIVIPHVTKEYRSVYGLERFANEWIINLPKSSEVTDAKSLLIIFDVEDYLFRLRTGSTTRKSLTDSKASTILSAAKQKVSAYKIYDAVYNILIDAYDNIYTPFYYYILFGWGVVVILAIMIFGRLLKNGGGCLGCLCSFLFGWESRGRYHRHSYHSHSSSRNDSFNFGRTSNEGPGGAS